MEYPSYWDYRGKRRRKNNPCSSIFKERVSSLRQYLTLCFIGPYLAFALGRNVDIGNLRETFFLNQVGYQHQLNLPEKGDFLIDRKWNIEVEGIGKDLPKSHSEFNFVAADGIETGLGPKIPLWLFGFLY